MGTLFNATPSEVVKKNPIQAQIDTLETLMVADLGRLLHDAPGTFAHVLKDAPWQQNGMGCVQSCRSEDPLAENSAARKWIKQYLHAGIFQDAVAMENGGGRSSFLFPFPDTDAHERAQADKLKRAFYRSEDDSAMQVVKYTLAGGNEAMKSAGSDGDVYKELKAFNLRKVQGKEDQVIRHLATEEQQDRLGEDEVLQVIKVIECGPSAARPHLQNPGVNKCLIQIAHEILMNLLLAYGNEETGNYVAKLQRVVVSYAEGEERDPEIIAELKMRQAKRPNDHPVNLALFESDILPTERIRFTFFIERVHIFCGFMCATTPQKKATAFGEAQRNIWPVANAYVRRFHEILRSLDLAGYVLNDLKEVNMGFALDQKSPNEVFYQQPKLLDFGKACLTNRRDVWGGGFPEPDPKMNEDLRPLGVILQDGPATVKNQPEKREQYWMGYSHGGTAGYISPTITDAYHAMAEYYRLHEGDDYMKKLGIAVRQQGIKLLEPRAWFSPRSDWFAASRVMLSQLGFDWTAKVTDKYSKGVLQKLYSGGGTLTAPAEVHFTNDVLSDALIEMDKFYNGDGKVKENPLQKHLLRGGYSLE